MASTLLIDVVQGPEERPGFGRCVLIEPVQPTTRPDRYPTQAVVVTSAARRLIELSKAAERLDAIVVHGELDPTLHGEFVEISGNLQELCRKWYSKTPLVLYCEAPNLQEGLVRHTLHVYDTVVVRFECSTQKTYKALTGRDGQELKTLVECLGKVEHRNLVIRSRFVRGAADNSTDSEVRGWIKLLAALKPSAVQIETSDKLKGFKPVPKTRISQIIELVTEKVGVPVEQL